MLHARYFSGMKHAIKTPFKPEDITCLRTHCRMQNLNYGEAGMLFGLRFPDNIVSVKARMSMYWPHEDQQAILDARARYQAGRSELCQGKQFGWYILYEFHRKQPAAPRPWFIREH